ncbi:MAG: Helix-turn-helix domain protein [Spirochaetes bacterium ADurb.Bin110]|jgi:excisionase family DNA binding protein|nr:MAG: Helix-turn-helix domain protein [Spirochaetes bacterium ADurb.Bin110]HNV35989.1 helix-turn-helix domain-containing protein [Rectinema sp.]
MTKFLSVDEAATLLKTTRSYIYKLVCERKLPTYKPTGGRLLFDADELIDFVHKGRKATQNELSDRADAILNRRP